LKNIFKYYFASFVLVALFMFMHYPPVYFTGTTIDYFQYLNPIGWFSQFIKFMIWSILLFPLLVFVKNGKWIGNIGLAIFSFMMGLEKYIFYIQGSKTAWNIGFNESMLVNFISMANFSGIKDAYLSYSDDIMFFVYLFVFPIFIFLLVKFILRYVPIMEYKYSALYGFIGFIIVLTFFETEENVPYFVRVPVVIEDHIINNGKSILFNYHRRNIFFKDVNKTKQPKNILFIMDESVRGDLISLNNNAEEKVLKATPFLYSIKDKLINFGNLYSIGNCSHQSNQLFLTGDIFYKDKENNVKTKFNLDLLPTIFQYMKNAGYHTYLLDSVQDGMYNGLKNYDKKYIDEYISFQKEKNIDRDIKSIEELNRILHNGEKNFIYVVKQGIHFPFEENFDKENPLFNNWNKTTQEGYFNLYMNAVKVAVDDYFKKLVKVVDNTDTVVLWQSDHAVNITPDNGEKTIGITHCETTMTHYKELYNVPAILYSPYKKYYDGYHNLKNGYSAKQMFSTILDFAGYSKNDYAKIYGDSFKKPSEEVYLYLISKMYDFNYVSPEENLTNLIDEGIVVSPLNRRRN